MTPQQAEEAPAIPRGYVYNWWQLASGRIVQICKLWHCAETGRVIATVRYIENEDGDLSPGSFDMALRAITHYARRVSK